MKNGLGHLDGFLLFLGVALLPVYAFESGGIQIAHAFLAIFAGFTFIKLGFPSVGWVGVFFAIVIYSFVVELYYTLGGDDPYYIINSLFFFYNFLIVCATYCYVSKKGFSPIVPGVFVAALIALSTIIITGVDFRGIGEGGRAAGSFNNPNQLGYFSVCLLSLGYLFYREGKVGYLAAVTLFSISLFLAISSLSKAAMVANFVVMLFALKPRSRRALSVWLVGSVAALVVLSFYIQRGAFQEYVFWDRLINMASENDSSLSSRGYFAFLEGSWQQILFGLGKGNTIQIVGHEVHSTFAAVLNVYGIVGFSIFIGLFAFWFLRLWQSYGFAGLICIAGPAFLYGLTHNGARFTIFWLLFAVSMALARKKGGAHGQLSTSQARAHQERFGPAVVRS